MHLDEASPIPYYQQIFEHFREGIERGAYPAGSKLPSIRALADDLACSRNTVEAAYRLLVQEGFAMSRPGSGYVIQDVTLLAGTPEPDLRPRVAEEHADEGETCNANEGIRYDFTYGNLQAGTFPAASWRAITDDLLLGVESQCADAYNDPFGELQLREEIAWRLDALRSISCTPEQVVIQGGTQSSIQNLLRLFDGTVDTVAMEDPGYDGVRQVFVRNRFAVAPCRVTEGYATFLADVTHSGAKLVFVTPSSQFPTCQIMPLETRKQLLEWAENADAYILEDDYCRDFRYESRPVPPLQSMDKSGRVIYMGTFSKSLSPALRMNYLVLPSALLEQWQQVFCGQYSAVPWLSQAVLERFMREGSWERHVRRLQAMNRRKHALLVDALTRYLGDRVEVMQNGTGLHLLVNVPDGRTQAQLIEAARAEGVRVYPTDNYWMRRADALPGCVLVGFSAIQEDDIEPGIRALARAWFG